MRRHTAIRLVWVVALGLWACSGERDAPVSPARPAVAARNLVLVTIDTLRADHLGAYGGDVATPHLDRLASAGALVEQAAAHVPLTRPSHVALMSGLLPTVTGVRDNISRVTIPEVPLLAEVLRDHDFATAAFVSAVVIARASGLDRGFDHYSDDFAAASDAPRFLNTAQKRGDKTLAEATGWLRQHVAGQADGEGGADTERFFLWLHLYDPHEPYDAPEPFASRYADRPYAGEVAWSDELVGRLDATLTELGVDDETLLVVTSDHGEGLGEHDELLHGFFAYETTLRVPLILRGPGVKPGRRLEQVTGLVDLYPTLLDLLMVPQQAVELSGRSLAVALGGAEEAPSALFYGETLVPRLKFGWSDLRVVRKGRYKYIQAPRPELYDLQTDPGETHNLVASERGHGRDLRTALAEILEREGSSPASGSVPDSELVEQLGALGYVGSVTAETATPDADPKDKIAEFRTANAAMREGLTLFHRGDYDASVSRLQELLDLGIQSSEIHLNLGRSLFGAGRFKEAAEHFLEAAARSPNDGELWLRLADARSRSGDPRGALEALRTGQNQAPGDLALRKEEARQLRLAGRAAEARRVLESAVELAPDDAFLRAGLSEVLRDLGDNAGAVARLREAVEIEPTGAKYWNALGMMLGGTGELAEAERAFRQAWRLDDNDHRHAFNLGLALLRQDQPAEARSFFEHALSIEPNFQPARQQLAALDPH